MARVALVAGAVGGGSGAAARTAAAVTVAGACTALAFAAIGFGLGHHAHVERGGGLDADLRDGVDAVRAVQRDRGGETGEGGEEAQGEAGGNAHVYWLLEILIVGESRSFLSVRLQYSMLLHTCQDIHEFSVNVGKVMLLHIVA